MAFSHEPHYRGKTDIWLTPKWILDPLGPFDLDPCASPVTKIATLNLTAGGLEYPWHGRVWLNPPYGPEARHWLNRLSLHGNGIALIFARTDTKMFQDYIFPLAHALLFLAGRVRFLNSDGEESKSNAGAPSVLVAYGSENASTLYKSKLPGAFVRLR